MDAAINSEIKNKIRGDWERVRGALKSRYDQLTDEDLLYKPGNEDVIVGNITKRIGKSAREVRQIIQTI
ncbi:MAG: general stress protein CsbD [Bacteroidetes bacterium]|nr:general stress protein CsbD [Bacteroidota bacterium]